MPLSRAMDDRAGPDHEADVADGVDIGCDVAGDDDEIGLLAGRDRVRALGQADDARRMAGGSMDGLRRA